MYISYIILVITLLALLFLLFSIKKNIKNIGQKIFFLYNNFYIIFIKNYYKNGRNKSEKNEIVDYYTAVSGKSSIENIIYELKKNKKFVLEYYKNDVDDIINLYKSLDEYESYYYSNKKSISIIILLLLIISLIMVFITK